jgi:hypothetical protein
LGVHNLAVETFKSEERLKQRSIVDEAAHPDAESTVDDSFLIKSLLLLFLYSQHGADHLHELALEGNKVDGFNNVLSLALHKGSKSGLKLRFSFVFHLFFNADVGVLSLDRHVEFLFRIGLEGSH